MKIVCESCGAKYSIADDRVVGKMFKIRCKKCSEVIVVRGDQQQAGAAESEAAAPAPSQTAIWHVVVEGEQAGPYSPSQLAEMLTSGAVDWEAYVWCEGFDNWLPMRDVPDLVAQITGQAAQPAAAAPAPSNYRNQQQTLTGQPSMGADPFAEEASANDSGMFGAQPAADLFARSPAQSASSAFSAADDPGVVSSSPSPRLSAERVLTGARNENSVLFSLKNLQSLATGSSTPSPPFGGGAAADRSGGFAGGEGSGLIDIRALASTTGMGDGGDGQKDELLSIGTQGGAFGTLGSPMLAPVAEDGDGSKKLIIWASVAAIGLLSIAGVAMAYLLRGQNAPVAAAAVGVAPQQPATAAAVAMPAQPAAAAPAGTAAPTEGELAAAKAAEQPARESDSSGHSSSGEHHKKHDTATSGKPAADEAAAPAPDTKKAPPKGGPRSIDDLLDGALSGSSSAKSGKSEAAAPAASNLGETPTRDQVLSAMNGVKPAVQACAKGENGIATVTVNVAGTSGHVTTAQVNGVTGPAGSCIAQAVRKAAFPKFKQNVFKITFPYKL
jgi:predicted Zn finger-like uncharacterized protein